VWIPLVLRKKGGVFVFEVVDAATGMVHLTRRFHTRVQVLRQDVKGDGVLDIVVGFPVVVGSRRLRLFVRLAAFDGLDLSPLPA
jgi:hypothetical protein